MPGVERRVDRRYPMVLQVRWPENPDQWPDCTENLSRGGLFVQTEMSAQVGQPVRLELSFPDLLAPLEISAQVTWVRRASPGVPAGIGVRMAEGAPDARAYLERLSSAAERGPGGKPKRTEPYRMIIVDDSRLCLELFQDAVRAAEDLAPGERRLIDVRVALRAQAALEMLRERPADLVMTDLQMPGMNGIELIREIRALSAEPRPHIVAVSGFSGPRDREDAIAAGADACIGKPAKLVDIASTVRALLAL